MTLTKLISYSKGLKTTDERVYKVIAIAVEELIRKLLTSLKEVNLKSIRLVLNRYKGE